MICVAIFEFFQIDSITNTAPGAKNTSKPAVLLCLMDFTLLINFKALTKNSILKVLRTAILHANEN